MAGQGKRKGGGGNPVGRARRVAATGDRMWVCRGCCCGTRTQHPGVDHRSLEKALRAGAQRAGLRYEVTDCLGPCALGNIVVVRREGRVRWYRRMNGPGPTQDLLEHLEHGDALPAGFVRHLMPARDGVLPDPG
ncbi:MAG: hypothetical protein JWN08_1132 [Frankiales bacterium]|nr:hypothetical protein [Frankiales bacterium]